MSPQRIRHYPYTRHGTGPAFFAEKATFDCAVGRRGGGAGQRFWTTLKLREALRVRLGPPPVQDVLLLVNRNEASTANTAASARLRAMRPSSTRCGRALAVAGAGGRTRERRSRGRVASDAYKVVDFRGDGPLIEQARLFNRAAAILSPMGAAMCNTIFSQPRTAVVEFCYRHGGQACCTPRTPPSSSCPIG